MFQEYDFKVVVKLGHLNIGLNHLSRIETGEEPTNLEEGLPDAQFFVVCIADGHYKDIIHFPTIGTTLKEYSIQQKKELVVCMADFFVIAGHLYKMRNDEILRRYIPKFERSQILTEAHGGTAGGHHVGQAQNILRIGLWWPTLHQDSKAHCKAWDICQRTKKPSQR